MTTILQLASLIRNQISPFITNTNVDINMIKDEIINTRNRLIYEYELQQKLLNPEQLYVEVNCIPIVCKDISECCEIDSDEKVLVAEIPELMTLSSLPNIRYIGTIDKMYPYNIVRGMAYLYKKYAKWTGKMKNAWYRQEKNQIIIMDRGLIDVNPKFISVSIIPKNEQDLLKYECACVDTDDVEFRCPDYLIDTITGKIVEQYMRQYQLSHLQPNTQSEILNKKI